MSELTERLKTDFQDREFRHVYADESLNTYIATQLKVLREERGLTQAELADLCEMRQSRISVVEDIDYSSWSISTLRRLAEAFDLRLSVKFESFGSLLPEIDRFSREELTRPSFDEDPVFSGVELSRTTDLMVSDVVILPSSALGSLLEFSVDATAKIAGSTMRISNSTASSANYATA